MATIYYGVPSTKKADGFVRFMDSDVPSQGHPLPGVGKPEWGFVVADGRQTKIMAPGAAAIALAICRHALKSDGQGLALYQRFKRRVMEKWPADQPWAITAEEVIAVCEQIIADELTPQQLQVIERDKGVPESEGGRGVEGPIVWDTDEAGNRRKPRGSDE